MPIIQSGTVNPTSAIVPDLYVVIVPPSQLLLNGVSSNVVGLVGTSSWGPVNQALLVSSMADFSQAFGPIVNRKYDMGTHAGVIAQQAGSAMMCVRVSDGTDVAATNVIGSTNITFSAKHTGSFGNNISVTLQAGAKANTLSAVVGVPGYAAEIYNNIPSVASVTTTATVVTHTATVNGNVTGSATFVVNSTVGLGVGDVISGTGISGSPTVASVTDSTTFVASTTQTVSSTTVLTFTPKSTTLTLATTTGIGVGAVVSGTGISGSPTVASITDSTHLEVSTAQSVANSASLTFTPVYSATWAALATAINNGQNALRGASAWITATAGSGNTAPVNAIYALAGGTDGATTITATTLVGDSATATGMYALGGSTISILDVCDADDSTEWTTIDAFAITNSCYAVQTLPAGTSVSSAISTKRSAGLDSAYSKLLHGDWLWWSDPQNAVTRLVSPQAFVAGRLSNLTPQNITLNKPIFGVAGSQKSGLGGVNNAIYSTADLSLLFQAGIDVVTNPGAGGLPIWTCRSGHTSSTNITLELDNYPTLTNYIAKTLAAGMGFYIGIPITPQLFQNVRATLTQFMQNLVGAGFLSSPDGSTPYAVQCNAANNPSSQTKIGIVQADVQAEYPSINQTFIVNLQGGSTVSVTLQNKG